MKRTAAEAAGMALKAEQALWHFEVGLRAMNAHLPVDWQYVAYRMAGELCDWYAAERPKRWREESGERPLEVG